MLRSFYRPFRICIYLCCTSLILFIQGCAPKDDYLKPVNYNKLTYFLEDNTQQYSIFLAAFKRTVYYDKLKSDGKYSLLIPGNNVFRLLNISKSSFMTRPQQELNDLMGTHVLPDKIDFQKLPYFQAQQIWTESGYPLIVRKFLINNEDRININGANILSTIEMENGNAYIIDKLLKQSYKNLGDAIGDQPELIYFNTMLAKTGWIDKLKQMNNITVFAPSNAALKAFGYSNLNQIANEDPLILEKIIQQHICTRVIFYSDLSLYPSKLINTNYSDSGYLFYLGYLLRKRGLGKRYGEPIGMLNNSVLQMYYFEGLFADDYTNMVYNTSYLQLRNKDNKIVDVNFELKDIIAGNSVIQILNNVINYN